VDGMEGVEGMDGMTQADIDKAGMDHFVIDYNDWKERFEEFKKVAVNIEKKIPKWPEKPNEIPEDIHRELLADDSNLLITRYYKKYNPNDPRDFKRYVKRMRRLKRLEQNRENDELYWVDRD